MRSTIRDYGTSLVCVLAAVALRMLLSPLLVNQLPFLGVLIAIAFIAYRFGVGPAIVGMLVGAIGTAMIVDPPLVFFLERADRLVGFAIYFIAGAFLIAVMSVLARAERKTRQESERLKQEVLARQRAEAIQEASAMRLRMAAEAVSGIIYEFDLKSKSVERTRGLFEILGYHPEEVPPTADWWVEQMHPEDRVKFGSKIQDATFQGASLVNEYRVKHKDGRWLDVEDRAVVVRDVSGQPLKMVGCTVNISERKRAERALRESESILRTIYESSPLMMGVVELAEDDTDILHIYDSPAVDRFMGNPIGSTAGRTSSENGVPSSARAIWIQNYRQSQRTMRPVRFEYEHSTPSGSMWLSCVVTCLGRHEPGRVRFTYISEDVTERKRAEEAIQAERSRLALGVQVAGLALAEIDYTTGLAHLSSEAAQMFGLGQTATVVTRGQLVATFHPEDRESIEKRIAETLSSDGPGWFSVVHRIVWPSGAVRWVRVRKQVIFKGEGSERRPVRATVAALDVTAERNAVEAVSASEQFVRGVLNSLPEHVVVLDEAGVVIAFNEPWVHFSERNGGLRQAVCEGADYLQVCRVAANQGDQYASAALEGLQAVIENRRQSFMLEYPCGNENRELWFLMHASRTQYGPVGVILSHIEITDRVLAERQLRESQDRLYQALDAAYMICFEWDITKDEVRRSFSNDSVLPATSSERPWTFEQVAAAIHPEDQDAFRANVDKAIKSETGEYTSEYRLVDSSGNTKWFFERGRVEFDVDRRPLRLTGLSQDISARKCAEQALMESESRFRIALQDSGILVYTTDADLRYTWVHNQHATFPADKVIGMRDDEILPQEQAEPLLAMKRRVIESRMGEKGISTIEVNGEEHIYNVALEPLRDARGHVVGVTAAAMEITAMKKAEQRIHALLEELRDADRKKDEFLATLAHELRNPLAPIRNSLELLKRAAGNPELLTQAQVTMDRQVGHMVRLIDDLLDVSRITSNKLELKRERVELGTIMQHAIEACRPNCERAEHELHVAKPSEPIYLNADPVRLTQVFVNLITNSCKYMADHGKIWFSAERHDDHVVVKVKDAGLGIPPEMLPKIFDLFTQVDHSLERTVGGLGIGLSLVKRLVEMHEGSVSAHSEGHGRGCEVTVQLPIASDSAAGERSIHDTKRLPVSARRILVVDDNKDAGRSLGLLLKISGHEVHFAFDGLEAIEKAEEVQPELILLDIGLPKMNGYDVCREVRTRSWGQKIVMVALTGWGQAEDRRKSREAGFDRHLVKPIEHDELTRILESMAQRTE